MAHKVSEFDAAFAERLLVSEQRRAWIMALVFSALSVFAGGFNLLYGFLGWHLPGMQAILLTFIVGTAYEWVTHWYFSRRLAQKRQPTRWRFYANALAEASIPTITLIVMLNFSAPISTLTSSITYLYFLIIILAALRLDFKLCLFTGLVAAVGFAGLIVWQVPEFFDVHDASTLQLRINLGMRCVLLIAAGGVAGLVSQVIRSNIQETMRGIEDRQHIVNLFGQHVSPQVVNQLLSQSRGTLSGQHEVCVLVLDIRRFTTFSENRAPDEVVEYLNTLWGALVHLVHAHHGIVNKFLGDGFMALFGVPEESENPYREGILAARAMLAEVQRLTDEGLIPPTQLGMALHAGSAIAGIIGSEEKKEYTVIGDVVNVTFRIEAMNKDFGSQLLVSARVRELAGIAEGERMEPMPIRGRRESIELFRLA